MTCAQNLRKPPSARLTSAVGDIVSGQTVALRLAHPGLSMITYCPASLGVTTRFKTVRASASAATSERPTEATDQ